MINTKTSSWKNGFPARKRKYREKVFRDTLCECYCNLYMESLIIDDPGEYSDSLLERAKTEFHKVVGDRSIREISELFENSSSYMKAAMELSEEIAMQRANLLEADDTCIEDDIDYSEDEKKLINDFETVNGKSDVGAAIAAKTIETMKDEAKKTENRRNTTKKLVGGNLTESAIKKKSMIPDTVFSAIFTRSMKNALLEATGDELTEEELDLVKANTVCEYAIYESMSLLGMKEYSIKDKNKLIAQYNLGKI